MNGQEPPQFVAVQDVCGQVELNIEILCRNCKRHTTLVFTPVDTVDYCGHCEEPYEYHLNFQRLFGAPEVI